MAALEDVNLLPEVMYEGLRACTARIDFEHPGDKHLFGILGQNLLIVTGRRALDRHPRNIVGREKLQFRLWHRFSPFSGTVFSGTSSPAESPCPQVTLSHRRPPR